MTRTEFDDTFAVKDAEGMTVDQLATLNDLVFEAVRHYRSDPIVPSALHQTVQREFEIASRKV